MTIDQLNQRIKLLEQLVGRLIDGKESLRQLSLNPLRNNPIDHPDAKASVSSQPTAPTALRFYYTDAEIDKKAKCYGSLEAGPINGLTPAVHLRGESGSHINIQSSNQISVQAGNYFKVNAQTINFEATRLNLDGEISGKIRYTTPFVWRSGQPPLKMINQDVGFPVITQISGDLSSGLSQVKTYVDPQDGYWYLSGSSVKKNLEIHAIVVGRV